MIWAVFVAAGFGMLVDYKSVPGDAASAPSAWPPESALEPAAGRYSLIVFAHPHCPCTRATLGELDRILSRVTGLVSTTVLFVQPQPYDDEWAESGLWKKAAAMPGVKVVRDRDAREARIFGAVTSGQVVLFDQTGKRVFEGGITRSRGHEGDNKGRSSIISIVTEDRSEHSRTSVFGCALSGEQSGRQAGNPTAPCTTESCDRDV